MLAINNVNAHPMTDTPTQHVHANVQHIFASANTLELSLADARAQMHSELQRALYNALDSQAKQRDGYLPEQWDATYELTPALGTWQDGAEPSQHLAWVHPRQYDALEVAEDVARQFGQKAVLVFSERAKGTDKLWEVRSQVQTRDEMNDALAPAGFRTVEDVPNGPRSRGWLVNPEPQTMLELIARYGWTADVHPGDAIMVTNPLKGGSGNATSQTQNSSVV